MTLRFYIHLVLILAALILNHLGKWPFLQSVIIFLALIPIISLFFGWILKSRLRLDLETEAELVERGDRATWLIHLKNPSYFLPLVCEARLQSAKLFPDQAHIEKQIQIPARGERLLRFEHLARHCGPLELAVLDIYAMDPAAFFRFRITQSKNLESLDKIYVLPQKQEVTHRERMSEQELDQGSFIAKKTLSEIDEIDRMRPMQSGDRLRSIHWKLSARVNDWMVKQYEKAEERQVLFLFDLPKVDPALSSPNREAELFLRDTMLEHSAAICQAFLVLDYIVHLRLPDVLPNQFTARKLSDFEFLRQALAQIPWNPNDALSLQVEDELLDKEKKLFVVVCQHLDSDIVSRLTLLEKENVSCLIAYYLDAPLDAEQRSYLRELEVGGSMVRLFNQFGEEIEHAEI